MYQIKEKILRNGDHERKILTIQFDQPEMAIVGEFLMTDASLLNYQVLDKLEHVLSGKKPIDYFTGNRCYLTIKHERTTIEDLYEGMDEINTLPSYSVATEKLISLVKMWRTEKDRLSR